jgi:hypothetical protein
VRHFIEMFVWTPSARSGPWTLQWHLFEVVRDQIIRVDAVESLATVDEDAPPARDTFDVREYAELRVDDGGHAEWAVLKGSHAATQRIESDAERREVRDAQVARDAAMSRVDWSRRYDVFRQPAMTYVDAEGCGHVQVYGWTADRAEVLVVRVGGQELSLSTQPATFELSREPVNLSVEAHVYANPQRHFSFLFRRGDNGRAGLDRAREVARRFRHDSSRAVAAGDPGARTPPAPRDLDLERRRPAERGRDDGTRVANGAADGHCWIDVVIRTPGSGIGLHCGVYRE